MLIRESRLQGLCVYFTVLDKKVSSQVSYKQYLREEIILFAILTFHSLRIIYIYNFTTTSIKFHHI